MNSARRVTQQDVATRAGVNRATVSLALHNHPSIPATTKDRICRIAAELGYASDPMLSAFAFYRNALRPVNYQGTLAWLANGSPTFQWNKVSMFCDYYQGAQKKAAAHGYNVEIFDLGTPGTSPQKLSKIFRFRNINGIFLAPQPGPNWELTFPWEYFSVVTFGYSLVRPALDLVAPTQFRAMTEVMRRLHALGYRRIGLAFSTDTDARGDHHFLGSYLAENFLRGDRLKIPRFDPDTGDVHAFARWHKKYRPEVVVTGNPRLVELIEASGLRVPDDIGVASPTLPHAEHSLAGIHENSVRIGEIAASALVGMVRSGARGIPKRPRYIHVPGVWNQGKTVREQAVAPCE